MTRRNHGDTCTAPERKVTEGDAFDMEVEPGMLEVEVEGQKELIPRQESMKRLEQQRGVVAKTLCTEKSCNDIGYRKRR